ncbi:unnamed protein product [Rhizoctonia solani]|uniref:Laminin domain protein n=1 Tax=Rhizoctonia solani TaxID=456999 RepID=A0A8H2XCZ3_9AGAM|nr:unnamed protein product [Rhizoctonia solani]
MASYPRNWVLSPPELPLYLKKVYELKPIVEVPSDEEVVGIHAVIRVANQVVDVQDVGDPKLLAQLSEHLFGVQMAKYQSKQQGVNLESTVFTPPTLPAHLSIQLEPVAGAPSEEEVVKVQTAIRSYQQYANSSMFDPRVDMELSQHLFDIQMARYTQRARQGYTGIMPSEIPIMYSAGALERATDIVEEASTVTNNPGSGTIELAFRTSESTGSTIQYQLIEQSNQIAERSNQLVERSSDPVEQLNGLFKISNEHFERLNEHLEESNKFAEDSTESTERLGDALENINRVLVKIQHAIVRNHKGNTKNALDCLVNEKGETPGVSNTVGEWDLKSLSENRSNGTTTRIPVLIDGDEHNLRFPDNMLGDFLYFYGIGEDLRKSKRSSKLKSGMANDARERLRAYWASCLG